MCGAAVAAIAVLLVPQAYAFAGSGEPEPTLQFPESTHDLQQIDRQLLDLGIETDFPDVLGTKTFDTDRDRLLINYYSRADPERVRAFLDAVDKIVASGAMSIELVPVDYSSADIETVIARIMDDRDTWAQRFGIGEIIGAGVDDAIGGIQILGTGMKPGQRSEAEGYPVSFVEGGEVVAQNRVVDSQPFTGGARLNLTAGSGLLCTMGWTWRKWSTGELLGGSAQHCNTDSGSNLFYNSSTFLGSRWYYNTQTDIMLLRSSPMHQFQPRVFIGGTNTSYSTDVVYTVGAPTVGEVVALSAAGSGGPHVGTVYTVYSLLNIPPYGNIGPLALTTVTACAGGDSGGPWLTTDGLGGAWAHGSHFGYVKIGPNKYCAFIPVINQSAAVSASIVTVP
jgi:hypothetical protein